MSRFAEIRQWLTDNPGWHFASDVADGLGAKGEERRRVAASLSNMSLGGVLSAFGGRGMRRYSIARQPRKYKRQGESP